MQTGRWVKSQSLGVRPPQNPHPLDGPRTPNPAELPPREAPPGSPLGLHIRIWLWHWTTGCRGAEAAAAGSGSEVVLVARSGEAGGEEEEENCVWQRSCVRDCGMPW